MKLPIFFIVASLLSTAPPPCAAQEVDTYCLNKLVRTPVMVSASDLSRSAFYKRTKEEKKWRRRRAFGYCNLVSGSGHAAFFTYTAIKERDVRWLLFALPFSGAGYLGFRSVVKAHKNLQHTHRNRLVLNVAPGSLTFSVKKITMR